MTLRIALLALVLVLGGATLPAGGAGIGDVISDFLYYQEELKVKAPARPVTEIVPGLGERYLALVDTDGAVRVWDFETGGQVTVEGRRPADVRAFFPNQRGANLIVVDATGRVSETAGMTFTARTRLLPGGSATEAVAVSPRAPVLAAAGDGQVRVYNVVTKQTVSVRVSGRVSALWVSDDGRFVAYEAGSVAAVIDADRQASLPLAPAGPATKMRFYADATGALGVARQESATKLGLYKFDGQSFARAGEHTFGAAVPDFWIAGGRVYSPDKNALNAAPLGGREKAVFTGKEPVVHVRGLKDDLLLVNRSGLMGVLNGKTGKIVATAISTENGWAVLDSSKRYDGSASGGREIAWVIQKTDLDLEKFARHFYEPGLLLRYVSAQPPAFTSTGISGPIPAPPTIADVKLLENVAGSGRTVVLATARNIKDDVAGIEIYLNGKRLADTAKITEEATRKDDLRFRSVGFQIEPGPGPNTVAVVGVGRLNIEGPTKNLTFDRPGVASGTLHAVTIGIDRYGAQQLRLGYARKDAEAIAGLLRAAKGYDKVAVAELYDASATRDGVLKTLKAAASAAGPGDAIVVYLAGHGVSIKGNWYFLSPAVTDVEEDEIVRLSASAEQIAASLRESKASRVVLMIDACHSGAVVKDVKGLLQNRIYTQLGRATGFAVLAAARQDQAALERNTLGHGVFTAAIVAGLGGAADRNGDGKVTARELAAYLARQIPTLATEHLNEIQIPVAYAPSEDFVVTALR